MTKRSPVFISHDTQALNLRRSACYCFFTRLKKKFTINYNFDIERLQFSSFLVYMNVDERLYAYSQLDKKDNSQA